MIKLEAKEDFSLKRFNEVVDLVRNSKRNDEGMIYKGDTFKCNSDLANYLCGNNPLKRAVVEIIEVEKTNENLYEKDKEVKKIKIKAIKETKKSKK